MSGLEGITPQDLISSFDEHFREQSEFIARLASFAAEIGDFTSNIGSFDVSAMLQSKELRSGAVQVNRLLEQYNRTISSDKFLCDPRIFDHELSQFVLRQSAVSATIIASTSLWFQQE